MGGVTGRPVVVEGVTPDLPAPDHFLTADIIKQAEAGPHRAEILAGIQRRKVVARVDLDGDRPQGAAGAA